ncbi:membrane lipoprotein lipid attachment site-containing protein [Naumannella sp. ID2617S]|nr:membrane lipoprotein lipid attachment site-containing protein [Naumannella sp. ID2617S]
MRKVIALLVATLTLTGCSAIPRDPEHTLERIGNERVLRLGVSPNPPWTTLAGDRVNGSEVDLVRSFATAQGATLETVVGGEEPLV